jgi:cell division protein FtsX
MNEAKRLRLFQNFTVALAVLFMFAFFIKALTEPPNWFFLSAWTPWLVFPVLEVTLFLLAVVYSREAKKLELKQ